MKIVLVLFSLRKSNVNTNHIPVILLTAKSRDEDRLEGLETGADAYIVKPFNMDILRRTIVNLLNARNLLRNKFTGNESQENKVDDVQMKSPDERLLERVMATINKNIGNSELSVDMIADEVGISRVHLHRKMKELTNQTPHDLIRNIRLKQAANLLANQHQNVTEVMYACGFNNSASFSTMFKNMYGMSPREYMKEHQQLL
jgi:AraC-like DNA-binding protein